MERTFRHSIWFQLSGLLVLVISFSAGKTLVPGEIVWQEGVAYREEGRQLQVVGDLEQAVTAYQKAIAVKPDYAEAYNDLGVVLESLGDLVHAEEAYKTALKCKPGLGAAHTNLALLYEETNRVKEAANHWGERVRLGPSGDSWVVRAREKLTKYNLPIPETAEDLDRKRREQVEKALYSGRAQLGARRWDQATKEFQRALELDPANARARKLLEVARHRASKAEGRQSKELFGAKARVRKQAVALRKKKTGFWGGLFGKKKAPRSSEAAREEALQRAEEMMKAQGEVAPPASEAEAIAREFAKEKSQVRGRTADDLYRRALTAMREGQYQDAVDQFKQIMILDPNNREAKQGLDRAQKALAKAEAVSTR